LPHDWAVEQPFSQSASFSHGFKAIGRNFPDASVGWYRKSFSVPASDVGKRLSLQFDGVFRNSIVWVNGHYLGTEPSGYKSFHYDISDYLNYGGNNVIAVRVDATMEEGWFYEGAGIYRHVWLTKTSPLHVAANGTFVTSKFTDRDTIVTAIATVMNNDTIAKTFQVAQAIVDDKGNTVASGPVTNMSLRAMQSKDYTDSIDVNNARLWSLEDPYLYKLITTVSNGTKIIDQYVTTFGIRTARFDPNHGFLLNGKSVKLKGTNNHQDHAGVGAAMPDGLQEFRIKALKSFGCNAYRVSHNPPTPEMLDACDRLGMLVIDENRLMGITDPILENLKSLIQRDRNHPSIISWSVGNEEWGIEGNIKGARIAATMQAFVKSLDTTRGITAAVSGGRENGISMVIDVMGYNYIGLGGTDEHHKKYPWQSAMGTEEGSTHATRGIYDRDDQKHYIPAYDKSPNATFVSIEEGWKYYAARPYLAGMFIWTGFDYRGEPTPYGWPSITSYFGMLDLCGFPKDNWYYLKSWWTNENILHILPHWNWKGKEGQERDVWVYSNCDEVELFVNRKSLGKKQMQANSHLEWKVKYEPGTVEAIGYRNGKKVMTDVVKTTAEPIALKLTADKKSISADQQNVLVVTAEATDKEKRRVPTANNEVTFSIQGPGKIIGVGNGDPTSMEQDKFIETIRTIVPAGLKEKQVEGIQNNPEIAFNYDDKDWRRAFSTDDKTREAAKAIVYRSSFTIDNVDEPGDITFFYKSLGREQSIYINGQPLATNIKVERGGNEFKLLKSALRPGKNVIAIVATPFIKRNTWDNINQEPGVIQVVAAAKPWKRKLFSGLAQVIIQSTGQPGEITLTATSNGLSSTMLKTTVDPNKLIQ
jgi:beta-galactosidase